jgi:hypothetical protein
LTSDDGLLRNKAREMIRAGRLPNRCPDRMWGGPGVGAQCAVCGAPVEKDEIEIEIEFDRDGAPGHVSHHLHVACLSALERERRSGLNGEATPPAGQPRSASPAL